MAAPLYSHTEIAGIVALYFVVSISLVFINKLLLSSGNSIPAPLFVTWSQCVVTVAICWLLGAIGEQSRASNKLSFWNQFPRYDYSLPIARKTFVLSVLFVGMITFNNICLQYVEVSFYNVARSLTIVFNVIFTYFILKETTSWLTCSTLAVVVLGFVLGTEGEVNFSLLGTLFGVASSAFVSLNAIFTKSCLAVVDGDKYRLAAYSNTNACIMFLPLILYWESGIIREHAWLFFEPSYWFLLLLSGVGGFAIGIVTMLQIQATSPLTHNISGTAKACVQTALALAYFRNPTTAANLAGIALVLFGSALYTWVRNAEMDAAKRATKPVGSPTSATQSRELSRELSPNRKPA